jgi:hypothetical protein
LLPLDRIQRHLFAHSASPLCGPPFLSAARMGPC